VEDQRAVAQSMAMAEMIERVMIIEVLEEKQMLKTKALAQQANETTIVL
jgi:hypothetical protein